VGLKKPRPLATKKHPYFGAQNARGCGKNDATVFKKKNDLYYERFFEANLAQKFISDEN